MLPEFCRAELTEISDRKIDEKYQHLGGIKNAGFMNGTTISPDFSRAKEP